MSLQQKASILQSHCSHSLSLEDAAKGGEGNQQTLACSAASCPPRTLHPWVTERPGTARRPESRAGSPKEAEPVPQLPQEGRTKAAAQARCAPAGAGEPQPPCAIPVPPEPAANPSPSPGKTHTGGRTDGRAGLPNTHSPAAPAQCAALGLSRGAPLPHPPRAAPPAGRPALPALAASTAASSRPARRFRPRRAPQAPPPARPAPRAPPSGGRERRQRRQGRGAPRGVCAPPCPGLRNGGGHVWSGEK
ncbi:transcription initiation factor TFIID subunit 4-like [Zonotrichia leucophrys gambelii]|uniref:transcription initiation factor TFIID subunit 4-like n=1 Tax=Zonotrichia leucophrys gambelii TaxID=257770 RepID=UPI003140C7CC